MIKAVIFDLSGVLFKSGTRKFVEELHVESGVPIEKIVDLFEGELGEKYRKAKISRDDFWTTILSELGIKDSIDNVEDRWIAHSVLIEETRDIILKLAKKYKVYYLSDNVRERFDRLNNKYSFAEWFEDGIISHDVGLKKPNPEIYKLMLKKAGVSPDEAIFIDDKEKNLPPAAALGIKTILFKNTEELEKELEEQHIL
jgi:epoxide hydrolase-like predicted phosphatase